MKKQKPSASTKPNATQSPQQLEEKIRVRAYQLFEGRGREHGWDLDDWLEAEAEIVAQSGGPRSSRRR